MLESHKLHFGRALKLRKQRRRCLSQIVTQTSMEGGRE